MVVLTETFDIGALSTLYGRLSHHDGIDIQDLERELARLFALDRSLEDLNNFRLSRGNWKKLADEVIPVANFLKFLGIKSGRVRFPLNSDPPDCLLWQDGSAEPDLIEVTIAQARERFHLSAQMIKNGVGSGFLGLSDDDSEVAFKTATARSRSCYSTAQAISAIERGIHRCLSRKNKSKFFDYALLVEAPLRSLPKERWELVGATLGRIAARLPFREVWVIGKVTQEPWGFRLK